MSSFIRVYRSVTRCCVVFNNQQRSGVVLNWKQPQAIFNENNIRLISRDVNSNLLSHPTVTPVFEKALLPQHTLTPLWLNMKTKHVKCKSHCNTSNKKKRHKHKKKKSKRKSKVKSKLIMAGAESITQEGDSSSNSDIIVVFEAKKPSQKVQKVQVEEIILDDDSVFDQVLLGDIPLPQESCDLAMIPLPQEENLPKSVQKDQAPYISSLEKMSVGESREDIKANVASNISVKKVFDFENEVKEANAGTRELRSWENTSLGNRLENLGLSGAENGNTVFSVMSYNVLAQRLLEDHMFLYTLHDARSLSWTHRSRTLLNEFRAANADVLCLQEVQFDHLEWFNDQLAELGYTGLFKRRTHDHVDGCAIYFKKDRFRLIESSSVEYYQPGVRILDRDNVALIARLEVLGSDQQLVVATTHLLFNPKRHDIKLAQTQLLLAELERIAYVRYDNSLQKPAYRPVIITGDFNLKPNSAVYRFLTDGFINYLVLSDRTLQPTSYSTHVHHFQQSLLPRLLQVSNTCQHLGILQHRQSWRRETLQGLLTELRLLQPYNSDNAAFIKQHGHKLSSFDERAKQEQRSVNDSVPTFNGQAHAGATTSNEVADGMEPGMLSHNFHLKSVYKHFKSDPSSQRPLKEATTHQNAWVTVDYIFYSGTWNQRQQTTEEGPLKLLSRFCLPTEVQCQEQLKRIPNLACGSDHLPLLARFLLRS